MPGQNPRAGQGLSPTTIAYRSARRADGIAPAPRSESPIPLSTAATQTKLTMKALAKLESKQAELKVENTRLKSIGYSRKYQANKRKLKQAELKVESSNIQRMLVTKLEEYNRWFASKTT